MRVGSLEIKIVDSGAHKRQIPPLASFLNIVTTNPVMRGLSLILLLSLAVVFSFFLIFSGCLAPSHADRCTGVASASMNDCLRETAVYYQEPETCYQIGDSTLREACLRDAVNPAAAQRLIDSKQAVGRAILTPSKPPVTSNKTVTPAPVIQPSGPSPNSADAQVADCMSANKMSQDACQQQVAVNKQDLSLCMPITTPDIHTHCIFSIASSLKDPAACSVLSGDDRQLCAYYSKGG